MIILVVGEGIRIRVGVMVRCIERTVRLLLLLCSLNCRLQVVGQRTRLSVPRSRYDWVRCLTLTRELKALFELGVQGRCPLCCVREPRRGLDTPRQGIDVVDGGSKSGPA